jgi:hypothetical protein
MMDQKAGSVPGGLHSTGIFFCEIEQFDHWGAFIAMMTYASSGLRLSGVSCYI